MSTPTNRPSPCPDLSLSPRRRRWESAAPLVEPLESRIAPALVFGIQAPPGEGSKLISFDSATPGTLTLNKAITGLTGGEQIVAMDFNPLDGKLYAASDAEHLFTLNTTTGAATLLGSFTFRAGSMAIQVFDIDFNPVTGSLRTLDTYDGNSHIDSVANPAAIVHDTDVAYTPARMGFFITAAAYDHNVSGATQTTLFAIDTHFAVSAGNTAGVLIRIGDVNGTPNSPNTGKLNPIGSLGLTDINSDQEFGFDIASDGTAYAALNALDPVAGTGRSQFYTVNLTTVLVPR